MKCAADLHQPDLHRLISDFAAFGATAVPGGCDTSTVVFGCDLGGGVIDWYYPPKTRDDAPQECGSDKILEAP